MSRTNLWHHTWIHHISTKNLEKELGLDSMNTYIARRQLRWLGHVSRMPFDRLPRRMLSSWLPAPRCTGAQRWPMAEQWKKLWRLSTLTLKTGTSLLLIAKSGTQWSNVKWRFFWRCPRGQRITHAWNISMPPPLFLCLVSFFSHSGESWNLCSLVGVGINYKLTN